MGLILQEAGGMRMIFRHPARQLTSSAKASEVILDRLMSSPLHPNLQKLPGARIGLFVL